MRKFMQAQIWMSLLLVLVLLTACSKERNPRLSFDQQQNTLAIQDVNNNSSFDVVVGNKKEQYIMAGRNPIVSREVLLDTVPSIFKEALKGLYIEAEEGQKIKFVADLVDKNKKAIVFSMIADKNLYAKQSSFNRLLAEPAGDGYKIPVAYFSTNFVKHQIHKDDRGEDTINIDQVSTDLAHATHMQINFKNAQKELPSPGISRNEAEAAIDIRDFADSNYYFANTLLDAPGSFLETFMGTARDMEIIRFSFEQSGLHVKRAYNLIERKGDSDVDTEDLLRFPIRSYYKIVQDPYSLFKTVIALPSDFDIRKADKKGQYLAIVDWSSTNGFMSNFSTIGEYTQGHCLRPAGGTDVSVYDWRNDNNIFAFTMEQTQEISSYNCANFFNYSILQQDIQKSFTFKERYSFKKITKESKPLFTLPYYAQKKLGFATFSKKILKANQKGNAGNYKNLNEYVSKVYDLGKDENGNFKQVRYILGGMPKENDEPELREIFITTMIQMVKDFNAGFRKALAGTAMERKNGEDVIVLVAEGLSPAEEKQYGIKNIEKGVFGDLDRNYIYFVRKQMTYGIAGLGGVHSDPKTGEIISGNVFIYGGNIYSHIENMKKTAQVKLDYYKAMGLNKDGHLPDFEKETSADLITAAEEEDLKQKNKAKMDKVLEELNKNFGEVKTAVGANIIPTNAQDKAFAIATSGKIIKPSVSLVNKLHQDDMALKMWTAFNLKENKFDQYKIMSIFEGKVEGKELIPEPRYDFLSKTMNKLKQSGFCAYDFGLPEMAVSSLDSSEMKYIIDTEYNEIFKKYIMDTAIHELGHNVGLRHNFLSKSDREGRFFDEKDKKENLERDFPRDYNSVMDYSTTAFLSYDGLGPQDVYTLRAIYPQIIDSKRADHSTFSLSDDVYKEDLKNGTTNSLRAFLGIKDWRDLHSSKLKENSFGQKILMPKKTYAHCTDEDVMEKNILCMPFIRGTTPKEYIHHLINSYRAGYARSNLRSDRDDFSFKSMNAYLGQLFMPFTIIRRSMELAVFKVVKGEMDAAPYYEAATEGMLFFMDVVKAPTAFAGTDYEDNGRFLPLNIRPPLRREDARVNMNVETKWFYDQLYDKDYDDQISVRGTMLDKVVAMFMLTGTSHGMLEFNDFEITMSYFILEKLNQSQIDAAAGPQPRSVSSLLKLVYDVINENVIPQVSYLRKDLSRPTSFSNNWYFERESLPEFKCEINKLLMGYTLSGLMVGLQRTGTGDIDDNPASAFTVYSSYNKQPSDSKNVAFVRQMGSRNGEYYWADEEAFYSYYMIRKIQGIDFLLDSYVRIKENLEQRGQLDSLEFVGHDAKNADKLLSLVNMYIRNWHIARMKIHPDGHLFLAPSIFDTKEDMSKKKDDLRLAESNLEKILSYFPEIFMNFDGGEKKTLAYYANFADRFMEDTKHFAKFSAREKMRMSTAYEHFFRNDLMSYLMIHPILQINEFRDDEIAKMIKMANGEKAIKREATGLGITEDLDVQKAEAQAFERTKIMLLPDHKEMLLKTRERLFEQIDGLARYYFYTNPHMK